MSSEARDTQQIGEVTNELRNRVPAFTMCCVSRGIAVARLASSSDWSSAMIRMMCGGGGDKVVVGEITRNRNSTHITTCCVQTCTSVLPFEDNRERENPCTGRGVISCCVIGSLSRNYPGLIEFPREREREGYEAENDDHANAISCRLGGDGGGCTLAFRH